MRASDNHYFNICCCVAIFGAEISNIYITTFWIVRTQQHHLQLQRTLLDV